MQGCGWPGCGDEAVVGVKMRMRCDRKARSWVACWRHGERLVDAAERGDVRELIVRPLS